MAESRDNFNIYVNQILLLAKGMILVHITNKQEINAAVFQFLQTVTSSK